MASREEIVTAIKQATGDPDSGAVAEMIPSIADAIVTLLTPPAEATRAKTGQETRLMNPIGETR